MRPPLHQNKSKTHTNASTAHQFYTEEGFNRPMAKILILGRTMHVTWPTILQIKRQNHDVRQHLHHNKSKTHTNKSTAHQFFTEEGYNCPMAKILILGRTMHLTSPTTPQTNTQNPDATQHLHHNKSKTHTNASTAHHYYTEDSYSRPMVKILTLGRKLHVTWLTILQR